MHHWQDAVLAISLVGFNIALLPSIWSKDKPILFTCLFTVAFLVPTLIVFISLSLWYSAAMEAMNLSLWATLAVQVFMRRPKMKIRKRT